VVRPNLFHSMLRTILLTPALASYYFLPGGPAPRSAETMLRPAPVAMQQEYVQYVQPRAPAAQGPGPAAAAVAFVASAAAAYTAFRSRGPSMQASADYDVSKGGDLMLNGEPLVGASDEFFNKVWDPLELGTSGSEQTLAWFRHAELKHCRAAMLASVGYLVQVNGAHFPGMLSVSKGVAFADLAKLAPYEAWEATPVEGKLQIALTALILEIRGESQNPDGHYMRGGKAGDLRFLKVLPEFKWDPIEYKRRELAELKHGRAAMLFLASLIAANNIPGSVPALTNATSFLG